jgi:cell division protein FtsQ
LLRNKNKNDNNIENFDTVINAKNKNKLVRQNEKFKRRMILILLLFVLIISSLFYYFSDLSNINEVLINGNYYLSEQEVLELTNIDIESDKFILKSDNNLKKELLKNIYIEDANIEHLKNNVISIEIQEKKLAGYVLSDNLKIYFTTGESIEISEEKYNLISYCPELNDFENTVVIELAIKMDLLSQETIDAMSEIYPYITSYDSNMIELLMSNGKYIFLSPNSISVLENYFELSKVLTDSDECLYIDELSDGIYSSLCPWDQINEQNIDEDGNIIEEDSIEN